MKSGGRRWDVRWLANDTIWGEELIESDGPTIWFTCSSWYPCKSNYQELFFVGDFIAPSGSKYSSSSSLPSSSAAATLELGLLNTISPPTAPRWLILITLASGSTVSSIRVFNFPAWNSFFPTQFLFVDLISQLSTFSLTLRGHP